MIKRKSSKPVAVTMGCPVGIGPEIILRLFCEAPLANDFVVIGDPGVMAWAARQLDLEVDIVCWHPGDMIGGEALPVFAVSELDPDHLRWGMPTRETGLAMAAAITAAVELVSQNQAAAMTTCPIAKHILNLAGYAYPGHTEMLAELTGSSRFRMMMAGDRLRVVLVTIHEPLAGVSGLLSRELVVDCIDMTLSALRRDFRISRPRVAVAGLNPHGGEEGMFGHEEEEIIGPAVAEFGEPVRGPLPPDTVFYQAASGYYDAVVAMYHDQGLIPFKLLHFQDGVNVTLGLPIVRTSVDHGTAYDIAGQGKADAASLKAAVEMARMIADNRTECRI